MDNNYLDKINEAIYQLLNKNCEKENIKIYMSPIVWRFVEEQLFRFYGPFFNHIIQKDLTGKIIKVWDNGSDDIKKYYKSINNIRAVCRKERVHAYNFIWEYKK